MSRTISQTPQPWNELGLSRDEQHRLKRRVLVKTAWQEFSKTGFHATSLDDIAKRLNVSKPAIYYYIKSKDELLYECHLQAIELFDAALAVARKEGKTGIEQLRITMVTYFESLSTEFGSTKVVGEDSALPPEYFKVISEKWDACGKALRRMVERGIKDGTVVPGDVKVKVFALLGAVLWLHSWFSPEGEMSAREAVEKTVAVLESGLAPRQN